MTVRNQEIIFTDTTNSLTCHADNGYGQGGGIPDPYQQQQYGGYGGPAYGGGYGGQGGGYY